MPTINQLSAVDSLSGSDLLPIYSQTNGDARKTSLNSVKEFVEDGFNLQGGILAISSLFSLRKTTQQVVAIGTSYSNIANWDSDLIVPSNDRTTLSLSKVIGEFVATRDISHLMMNVLLTGSWPSNRDLTLGVLIGTDANPYESSFKFIGAGRGGGNPVTAAFSGPAANLNNGGNVIREGEKIRLVAKFNVADNLIIDRAVVTLQTLDGI